MRRCATGLSFALCLLLGAILAPTSVAARADSLEEAQATAGKLSLKKRQPEEFTLDNGLRVFCLTGRRLPLVTVRAVIRCGALWEPAAQPGVADLTGRMLRRGGTTRRGPDETDEELDFLAAQLFSRISAEQGNVTLNVLTENLDPALEIFADILRRPLFAEDKIEVQKELIKEQIRRQNDDPVRIAFREYSQLVWGEDHPRARTPTEESVDRLTREDLTAFHRQFFAPGNVLIGVAGDISKKEAQQKLAALFGDWEDQVVRFPEIPAAPPRVPRVAVADKDLTQSTIVLGHLGPTELDPYRASGQVMMDILGSGGFTSYIIDRVRNDSGLAYLAGGFLSFGRLDRGLFAAYALSKAPSTCEATRLILEQIERIREEPVTDEELRIARDGILNAEAFRYDSTEEIVDRLLSLTYYGLPADHDEKLIERVAQVSRTDVQDAARALLAPDELSLLAVGSAADFDCDWSEFAAEWGVTIHAIELEGSP